MGKQSHGTTHYADTTVECPSCGRKFIHPHHAGVAEDWGEWVGVQFKSKQDGRWGVLRVPIELIFWGDSRREAWDAEIAQRPRNREEALARMPPGSAAPLQRRDQSVRASWRPGAVDSVDAFAGRVLEIVVSQRAEYLRRGRGSTSSGDAGRNGPSSTREAISWVYRIHGVQSPRHPRDGGLSGDRREHRVGDNGGTARPFGRRAPRSSSRCERSSGCLPG
jgi:hypothetical protein